MDNNKIPISTSRGYVADASGYIIDFLYRQGDSTYKISLDVSKPPKSLCHIDCVARGHGLKDLE